MIDALAAPYTRTAVLKGLPASKVVLKHGLLHNLDLVAADSVSHPRVELSRHGCTQAAEDRLALEYPTCRNVRVDVAAAQEHWGAVE